MTKKDHSPPAPVVADEPSVAVVVDPVTVEAAAPSDVVVEPPADAPETAPQKEPHGDDGVVVDIPPDPAAPPPAVTAEPDPVADPPLDTKNIKRKPGSVKKTASKPKPEPATEAPTVSKPVATAAPPKPTKKDGKKDDAATPTLRKLTPKDRITLRKLADTGAIKHRWGEPWVVTPELIKMLDTPPGPKK